MGFVIIALIAVALTAAFVVSEAIGKSMHNAEVPAPTGVPEGPAAAVELATPTRGIDFDLVDAPTQGIVMPPIDGTEAIVAAAPHLGGHIQLRPDPDRLIQHEEIVPDTGHEHSAAMTKLAVAIAGSGIVLGLGIMGLARGVNALIRLLTGS